MKKNILLLLLLTGLTGCNWLDFPLYVLFGQTEQKVKAEYHGLKNQRCVILIVSRPAFDFEYPYAGLNLALACAYTIGQHVKGATFAEQEKIYNFQFENLDWHSMPISEIARRFDAQRVIYLDLYEFNMYEENSINLLRGHISADVRIYEMDSATPDQHTYQTDVGVVVPEHGPVALGGDTLAALQQQSMMMFADALAKKFYDHKIPVR